MNPVIRASIDLGTNTCLLLVVEWDSQHAQIKRVLGDYSTIVRLGEGVGQTRRLQNAAMDRTRSCLKEYVGKLKEFGVPAAQVICVATSQARDAQNGAEFFALIQKELGLKFQVISGDQEARLSFQGALFPEMDPAASWVIDIGGGSTEIISKSEGKSIDMGSVRFTEAFLKSDPVTDPEFWKCQEVIDEELASLIPWRKAQRVQPELIAVAGTATTLASWYLELPSFNAKAINEVRLSRGDLHRMVEELKWRTVQERSQLVGIEPKRADVILAGALILWRTLELLDFAECRVSTQGLRYGVLLGLPVEVLT